MIKIINEITFCICVLILIFTCVGLSLVTLKERKERKENDVISKLIEEREKHNTDEDYVKPKFKELTQEQMDDIHARGKITPEEKVKEWEGMDLCAPGDAIGSAAWRCRKFKNCHDCLVDYANEYDEHTSTFDNLKIVNHIKYKIGG